ncbi:DUF308 domain-containing protein [Streptomyces hirsutus]|uniref:DUF308 domain-containing protein n=2 Tax=Streptomyces hirsutus TaxID=35620 RepID=UPI0006E14367|nr:DUF308 domain-containing protein [Streptomyces hirsutus]
MTPSSKSRPRDWHPLAESDPVPGDPEEVRSEVKHMKSVAGSLREQVRLLRGIGNDNELKGKYATKLKEGAEGLEKRLGQVASRYERVHGHLTNWANDLEDFQTEADKVLANAKKEQELLEAEKAKKESGGGEDKTPDPSPNGAESDPLHEFRAQLERIKGNRDERARHHAGKIRDQLDDAIEDSWWDDLKGWIHDNIDTIKVVLDALGWAATIIGVIALFIPGLNVLALALGGIIFGARALLAATGEASWMEVAMDSLGLLTMGAGRAGLTILKGANAATKAGAVAGRQVGLKAGLRAHKSMMNSLQRAITNTTEEGAKKFYKDLLTFTRKKISDDAGRVAKEATESSAGAKWAHLGDGELHGVYSQFAKNKAAFPEAAVGSTAKARAGYGISLAAIYAGAGADVTDKTFGQSDAWSAASKATDGVIPDKWSSEGYNDWKENTWKAPIGSSW